MFQKYAATVLNILTLRGSFDTDPATLVNHTLEALSGLVLADAHAARSSADALADAHAVTDEASVADLEPIGAVNSQGA